jgi:hypothetical protein
MLDYLTTRIIKIIAQRKIAYLERMINYYHHYNAEICRDGKSKDWHNGKREGIMIALSILTNRKLDNEDDVS